MQLKCTVADITASSTSSVMVVVSTTKEEETTTLTTTKTINKWSLSSSPNNNDDKSPSSSSSSSGTMTTTTMTTIYRNNAQLIYPFKVEPTNPEHLIHVAIALCPELLIATTTDDDDDDDLTLQPPSPSTSASNRGLESYDDAGDYRKKYHHPDNVDEEEATTKSLSSSSSSSSSSARRRSQNDDDDEDSDDSDDFYDDNDNHRFSVVISNDHDEKRKKEDDTNRLLSMFTVQPLTGGLSNELFIVTHRMTDNKVLVRIHPTIEKEDDHDGDNSHQEIVDRSMENRLVAWLSAVGDAPLYYGRFCNGRVEEFYHNHMTLSWNQMKDYAIPIAAVMANVHTKIVPSHVFPSSDDASTDSVAGHIWHRGDVWLQMAYDRLHHHHSGYYNQQEIVSFLQLLENEWTWLKQQLMKRIELYNQPNKVDIHDSQTRTTNNSTSVTISSERTLVQQFCAQIVLTHMDCQSLNLLRKEDTPSVLRLIDYEYAGYNPRAADIANTFCEYCNMNQLCADYEKEYPTDDVQHQFFVSYLRTLYATKSTDPDAILHTLYELLCHHPSHDDNHDIHTSHPTAGFDKDLILKEVYHEIGQYTLISHITWSIWSMVQLLSIHQSIDFDYMAYAQQRMKGYEYFRQRYYFFSHYS